jgi:hypothetical protein
MAKYNILDTGSEVIRGSRSTSFCTQMTLASAAGLHHHQSGPTFPVPLFLATLKLEVVAFCIVALVLRLLS